MQNLFEDCRTGQLPRKPFMNGATPSYHDPNPGAAGQSDGVHVAADDLQSLGQSVELGQSARRLVQETVGGLAKVCAQLDDSNILSTDSTTPLDIERHDKNMYCGDWMVGEYSGDQALENRPFPGWGQYKTPIDGLFMCGSSCHPGGNITGAPGYNAAKVIAESLGLKTWWNPVDFREH